MLQCSKLGLWVLILVLFSGCILPFPKGTEFLNNKSYGSDERNRIDIFLPEQRDTSTETVMLIHGGAWVAGDKAGPELKEIRNTLLESGYAVASMNYRYACGEYHKQMEDVGLALEYLSSHAAEWNVNSERYALVGFSAGGHLSLLYSHAFNQNHLVKTVISNVGPTDLTNSLFRQYIANYSLTYTLEQLLGATFEEDSALYAEASPLFHSSNCPTLFLYGGLDDLVPKEQGIAMFDTLIANGVVADTTIPALGTHNINGPSNVYKSQIENEVLDWLQLHLNQ
jgi:acetyl esterase/lipase